MFGGFEQFFGSGGGGGGPPPRGGSGGGGSQPVDNESFYKILGVEKGCSEQELKKAWRKTAAVLHPDRGGDTQKFQEAQRAYEILSDPDKRARYDRFGEAAFSGNDAGGGGSGGGDMDDVLRAFFGGGGPGGGGGGRRGPPRGRDVGMKFEVSLEELYSGAEKKVEWERKTLCKSCDGNGGPPEAKTECSTCDGHGVVIRMVRMGPMIQQEQRHCPDCRGQGYSMKESLKCRPCNGQGIVQEKVDLTFTISPGMQHGEKIKLAEEGDRVMKEMIPGDVYMVLEQTPHPEFERKGDHLIYKKKIALLEALTGFQFIINHLDGRQLRISSPHDAAPHQVVKPGDLKIVSNEGMPTHRNPLVKGSLVVQFEVEFPSEIGSVGSEEFKILHKFLPVGENTHSKFKEYLPEDEQKIPPAAASAGGVGKKKKKNKKKKAAAAAAAASAATDSAPGEDDAEILPDEPVDVLLEDISMEAFNNMRKHAQQGRSHQHATDEDDEMGGGGGTQCRVN